MRPFAVCVTLLALFGAVRPAAAEDAAHRRLAERYAPVVLQESRSAVLDSITKFDFDGDWLGDNNWRNAYVFDLPGYAYYSVIESTRHYFITYAFFHPRDFTARPFEGFAPKTEHENDMEGCTVTIEKDGTQFGKPILLQTLAHDVFFKYNSRDARRVTGGAMKLDGQMTFIDDRPAVYIEAEGHGVKGATPAQVASLAEFPGLVYRLGEATVPRHSHDHEATYDLVSIEDTLWAHRFDVGSTYCCADSYLLPNGRRASFGSAFNGPVGGCAAKPPWGWDQANDALAKGDWFRDPLRAYATQLRIENFTGRYVHNPYLQAESRDLSPMCQQSATATTVKGSLIGSLFGIGQAITSNGLGRGQIGGQARQLFLSNTVLLEWAKGEEFQKWSWDTALNALTEIVSDGPRDELRLQRAAGFAFMSPSIQAPSRYFDSLVLRYRTPLDGLTARVSWVYDAAAQFSNELSATAPLPRATASGGVVVRLRDNPKWDPGKTVARIRVTIESATGTVATATPGDLPNTEQLAISQIVFDRDAFSNTFERPTAAR
jgi:hypothetical protein